MADPLLTDRLPTAPPPLFDPDPSRRWLFCLTHPDDEITVACWVRRLVGAGAPVFLSWTHDTPVRRPEAMRFARMTGVPEANLLFHGASDGRVCEEMPGLLPRFERMMQGVKPHVVACGAFEQGHLDHDATNLLVSRTHRGPVAEIPFYHSYLTRLQRIGRFAGEGGPVERLDLDPDERAFKRAVARAYPSQNIWRLVLFHEGRELVSGRRPELGARELLRLQTWGDFRVPNHPEPRRSRIARSARWARWLAAVERLGI